MPANAKGGAMSDKDLDLLAINTIRTLSIDAVQAAKSGHPGTPMALAPLVYTLWNRVMRFDPQDPIWPNRDRFVLSNGHASMLLWSVLHLTRTQAVNADYEKLGHPSVSLDDIRHFRKLDSKAPGHPESHWLTDVEARFLAYGWNVLRVGDANDIERIEHALDIFRKTKDRPTFIVLDSHIGYGSPHRQDTAAAHGEPLGDEEVRLTKRSYGWPEDAKFLVPDGVYEHFAAGIGARGAEARRQWTELFAGYRAK